MTKEELEKEAYLYAKNSKDVQDFECGFDIAFKSYLASAKPREKRIADLEKENAELQKKIRCECTRCVYSDSPCTRSDYGIENDKDVCPNYENVFVAYTQLKEENAELRKEWQEQVQKATDEGYARTLQTMQLTKAKEILKAVVDFYPTMTATILLEAEQFLNSEVEK